MVTVTNTIPLEKQRSVAQFVAKKLAVLPELTPRTETQLLALIESGNLAVAWDNGTIIGWLIATPYTTDVQEIGTAYVEPKYRSRGIINQLVEVLLPRKKYTVAVTYQPRLVTFLTDKYGFRDSSLAECVVMSRGKFVLWRLLDKNSRRAVTRHLATEQPHYVCNKVGRR